MSLIPRLLGLAFALVLLGTLSVAREPQDKDKKAKAGGLVERMMAFDKNKDGKLTKDEITDERLLRLFDRADANKDGTVTRAELEALAAQEDALGGDEGGKGKGGKEGGKGGKGKGGFDGPGEGKGPKGGFGRGGQPGQILPPFLQEELGLSEDQKKELATIQKDIDARLDKLLTEKQQAQLRELRERGPGGPGEGKGGKGKGGKGKGGPPDRE